MSDESDNVVWFTGETSIPIPSARVLEGALKAGVENAVVIGNEADGTLYVASSDPDFMKVIGQLEVAKQFLLRNYVL